MAGLPTSMILWCREDIPSPQAQYGRYGSRRRRTAPNETIEVHGDMVDATARSWPASSIAEVHAGSPPWWQRPYAGHSALTVNDFGSGKAYCRHPLDETGMDAFMASIVSELGLGPIDTPKM